MSILQWFGRKDGHKPDGILPGQTVTETVKVKSMEEVATRGFVMKLMKLALQVEEIMQAHAPGAVQRTSRPLPPPNWNVIMIGNQIMILRALAVVLDEAIFIDTGTHVLKAHPIQEASDGAPANDQSEAGAAGP